MHISRVPSPTSVLLPLNLFLALSFGLAGERHEAPTSQLLGQVGSYSELSYYVFYIFSLMHTTHHTPSQDMSPHQPVVTFTQWDTFMQTFQIQLAMKGPAYLMNSATRATLCSALGTLHPTPMTLPSGVLHREVLDQTRVHQKCTAQSPPCRTGRREWR